MTGLVKTAFSLRYQDIRVGTGTTAEFMKQVTVQYKGYLGVNGRPDDGRQFDSSYTRQSVVMDDQHKMVMGPDGKPKMTDPHPEPFAFVEGNPRLIPGWNLGVDGMKVGGKRRIFIPWQLAYGAQGRPGPDAEHPGIPPKADLIFDIELVDVKDAQMPPSHPQMSIPPHAPTPGQGAAPAQPAGQPAAPAATPAPATGAPPATPAPPQPK
jgi:peptidylprolyl isomerase